MIQSNMNNLMSRTGALSSDAIYCYIQGTLFCGDGGNYYSDFNPKSLELKS